MNQTRHHLLAGARLAANEHVGLRVGHAGHEVDHPLHLRRVADHQAVGVLALHPLLEIAILILERLAQHGQSMEIARVVDGCRADGRQRFEEAKVVLSPTAALRGAALFLPPHTQDADDGVAGDHRRDELIARRDRRADGHGLLDRAIRQRRRLMAEAEHLMDVELFVEREDEAGHRIEDGNRALHQLLEQLPFGAQRVQRAPHVVEGLELEELSA